MFGNLNCTHICIFDAVLLLVVTLTFISISRLQDRILLTQWKDEIVHGFQLSTQIMANMNKKVSRMYGAPIDTSNRPIGSLS